MPSLNLFETTVVFYYTSPNEIEMVKENINKIEIYLILG